MAVPGKVNLDWNAPTNTGAGGITGYRIYLADGTFLFATSGTATNTTVTGLTPGLNYTFKVAAKNALANSEGSQSAYSNSVLVTPIGEPLAPTNLTVRTSVSVSMRLVVEWDSPGGPISGYKIFRRVSGADTLVGTVNATHTQFAIDDLDPGTTYTYLVRARSVYTDTLDAGYPGNWGGPASGTGSATATINNTQDVSSLPAVSSGTNTVFNGTYTVSGITPNSVKYAKANANIPTASSGGTIINNTNAVFNGEYVISVPTSYTIAYAKTNANIPLLPLGGGIVTDLTNVSFEGATTATVVNVGAHAVSYANTGSNVAPVPVGDNLPPGQTGWITNLVNSVFNGPGKTITAITEFTFSYAQTAANVAPNNAAGVATNTTNRDIFNGLYQILSIPAYNTVKYNKINPNIATRTWYKPNGVVYRETSPASLSVRYRSGWAG